MHLQAVMLQQSYSIYFLLILRRFLIIKHDRYGNEKK
jgi:hypothetical protein